MFNGIRLLRLHIKHSMVLNQRKLPLCTCILQDLVDSTNNHFRDFFFHFENIVVPMYLYTVLQLNNDITCNVSMFMCM